MGALAVLPHSGLRSHGGHQPAPPGLENGAANIRVPSTAQRTAATGARRFSWIIP